MKIMTFGVVMTVGFWAVGTAAGAVSFDATGSTWGSGNAFFSSGGIRTDSSPDASTAYGGESSTSDEYVFGFAHTAPVDVSSYDLSTTDLTAGTALTLRFTGFTSAPRYVAYTGGMLTSYAYDSTNGILTLITSVVDPVASASDTGGSILNAAFGLRIVTGGAYDFGGTVFRSDGYWGDIDFLVPGYTGPSLVAGVNFNGQNGAGANFAAYLPTAFLTGQGILSPADCQARLDKAGATFALGITRELFAPVDPGLPGSYTYGGASSFDFTGGGSENYILASYSNDSWSNGNIGIEAIPEPAAMALGLGVFAFAGCLIRRRHRTAAGSR